MIKLSGEPQANISPVANFTESTETAYVGEAIAFNASDSYDPDGYISTYLWDFGDSTNTTGVIVQHAYSTNGTYIVTLTVTDDDGATDNATSTKTILPGEPSQVHDVAVASVESSKTGCLPLPTVGEGFTVNITVIVENQGDFSETFNVTAFANNIVIGNQSVMLSSGESTILTFVWNTTGFVRGNYTSSAAADIVPSETDTADNTFTAGLIVITRPGDINADGFVNAKDAIQVGNAFYPFGVYNPNADINNDGFCNAKDAIIIGTNFD